MHLEAITVNYIRRRAPDRITKPPPVCSDWRRRAGKPQRNGPAAHAGSGWPSRTGVTNQSQRLWQGDKQGRSVKRLQLPRQHPAVT
jgi:hypothetical protein